MDARGGEPVAGRRMYMRCVKRPAHFRRSRPPRAGAMPELGALEGAWGQDHGALLEELHPRGVPLNIPLACVPLRDDRTRSCCTWQSSCRASGAPSPPSWAARRPSASNGTKSSSTRRSSATPTMTRATTRGACGRAKSTQTRSPSRRAQTQWTWRRRKRKCFRRRGRA